jgi:hypothetical protein
LQVLLGAFSALLIIRGREGSVWLQNFEKFFENFQKGETEPISWPGAVPRAWDVPADPGRGCGAGSYVGDPVRPGIVATVLQ